MKIAQYNHHIPTGEIQTSPILPTGLTYDYTVNTLFPFEVFQNTPHLQTFGSGFIGYYTHFYNFCYGGFQNDLSRTLMFYNFDSLVSGINSIGTSQANKAESGILMNYPLIIYANEMTGSGQFSRPIKTSIANPLGLVSGALPVSGFPPINSGLYGSEQFVLGTRFFSTQPEDTFPVSPQNVKNIQNYEIGQSGYLFPMKYTWDTIDQIQETLASLWDNPKSNTIHPCFAVVGTTTLSPFSPGAELIDFRPTPPVPLLDIHTGLKLNNLDYPVGNWLTRESGTYALSGAPIQSGDLLKSALQQIYYPASLMRNHFIKARYDFVASTGTISDVNQLDIRPALTIDYLSAELHYSFEKCVTGVPVIRYDFTYQPYTADLIATDVYGMQVPGSFPIQYTPMISITSNNSGSWILDPISELHYTGTRTFIKPFASSISVATGLLCYTMFPERNSISRAYVPNAYFAIGSQVLPTLDLVDNHLVIKSLQYDSVPLGAKNMGASGSNIPKGAFFSDKYYNKTEITTPVGGSIGTGLTINGITIPCKDYPNIKKTPTLNVGGQLIPNPNNWLPLPDFGYSTWSFHAETRLIYTRANSGLAAPGFTFPIERALAVMLASVNSYGTGVGGTDVKLFNTNVEENMVPGDPGFPNSIYYSTGIYTGAINIEYFHARNPVTARLNMTTSTFFVDPDEFSFEIHHIDFSNVSATRKVYQDGTLILTEVESGSMPSIDPELTMHDDTTVYEIDLEIPEGLANPYW